MKNKDRTDLKDDEEEKEDLLSHKIFQIFRVEEINDGISSITKSNKSNKSISKAIQHERSSTSKLEKPFFSLKDLIQKPLNFFNDKIFLLRYEGQPATSKEFNNMSKGSDKNVNNEMT